MGGKSELNQALTEMDQQGIQRYATEQGCEWIFNPPHASHFGGVWERQIRTIRSILDAMLTQIGSFQIELLSTLMAEVTGIVNFRPLAAVTSDPDEAQPLSPSMLLTMKTRPLAPPAGNFVPEDLYARMEDGGESMDDGGEPSTSRTSFGRAVGANTYKTYKEGQSGKSDRPT